MSIQLDQVIPWGRSFDEYRRMFDLSPADLRLRILGCADGPASFNAEATAQGLSVTSSDPIYTFTAAQIEQRVLESRDDLLAQVRRQQHLFVWREFTSPEHVCDHRLAVMRHFLADFEPGKAQRRYITASLPALPFEDNSFDLALVSHFLFLYSDNLGLAFHIASIRELLRVAREVRIFPLLTLSATPSPFVQPIIHDAVTQHHDAQIQQVPYEFQRNGNQMLRIRKRP